MQNDTRRGRGRERATVSWIINWNVSYCNETRSRYGVNNSNATAFTSSFFSNIEMRKIMDITYGFLLQKKKKQNLLDLIKIHICILGL